MKGKVWNAWTNPLCVLYNDMHIVRLAEHMDVMLLFYFIICFVCYILIRKVTKAVKCINVVD